MSYSDAAPTNVLNRLMRFTTTAESNELVRPTAGNCRKRYCRMYQTAD
jgi:hypothetical protein